MQKSPFTYFLFKILLLFSIIFVFDMGIGKVLSYYYFKQESGLQYRTTYSIEETRAELLVFGSSRANHHYHPDVLESHLKMNIYNVGRDGSSILYHAAVLKGVLKRYFPKVIILDINVGEFYQNTGDYDRISSLLPYYKTHPEMQSIIELKSKYEKYKLFSSIYPNNSSITTIIAGNSNFNKNRKGDNKGYIPLKNVWRQPILIDNTPERYEIDSTKVKVYEAFIQDCINAKVKLYIICSPKFIKYNHTDYSIKMANEIALKYNVEFYDFTNNITFTNKIDYFADIEHLNENGAKTFSMILTNKIKSIK